MKPDWEKFDAHWEWVKKVQAEKRANGWDGDPKNHGRDFNYGCEHGVFAGWGVSDEWLKERGCACCDNVCPVCRSRSGTGSSSPI